MAEGLPALVSLHDVMPETLSRVDDILTRLKEFGIPPITLLVVPGRAWTAPQIERLRGWAHDGHELAAHGWRHHVDSIRGWKHRLHAALISRQVAEHLALNSGGILQLMVDSQGWFFAHRLPQPTLYVPPAWALGATHSSDLVRAPFTQIETLYGLVFPSQEKRRFLPLVGYEADTTVRALSVRLWNSVHLRLAKHPHRPLRIAIHPNDFHLRLAGELDRLLQQPLRFMRYADLSHFRGGESASENRVSDVVSESADREGTQLYR